MTTAHSYTNDQVTLDFPIGIWRGASSRALHHSDNYGAAKAIGKSLLELNGKLNGVALRVPTPDVHS